VISTYDIEVVLTVSGIERELSATVRYEYSPAFRGNRETPDERENAEVLTVHIEPGHYSILHLLSDKQIDAITEDILSVEP
jgi:hypothetical protein